MQGARRGDTLGGMFRNAVCCLAFLLSVAASTASGVAHASELSIAARVDPQQPAQDPKAPGAGADTRASVRAEVLALQPKIDEAIDRGVENILSRQLRDGSWGAYAKLYRNGQTALSAYMLIKAGVDRDHPAVQRALKFLDDRLPYETYSAGCQLLFYESLRDPKYHPRMNEIIDLLMSWQWHGAWSYPNKHGAEQWGRDRGAPDLSNMQYAALGILAATRIGRELPAKNLKLLIARTLDHQERVSNKQAKESKRYGLSPIRGFCYRGKRGYGGEGQPSGSMTAAGVSILQIALDALGKRATSKYRRDIEERMEAGVRWLAQNFAVDKNPNRAGAWLYYYLYGLERVGSLLRREQIGEHYWYRDGAKFLVSKQQARGQWGGEFDTCFAVLFLKRATAAATGGAPTKKRDVWLSDGKNSPLRIRATGHSELSLWVMGFDDATKKKHEEFGIRVARVEWYVDGEKFATIPGDVSKRFEAETYATRYRFVRPKKYAFTAKAFALTPDALDGDEGPLVEIPSAGFTIPVSQVMSGWMKTELDARDRNLLRGIDVVATGTTSQKAHPPKHAVDGRQATRWVCDAKDAKPRLTLKWTRWIEAERVILEQAVANAFEKGMFDDIRRVEVAVNGRDRFEVTMAEDVFQPTTVAFPRKMRIRRLDVTVLERKKGWAWPGQAGLTEVRLETGAR